jgi:hypothetical protein
MINELLKEESLVVRRELCPIAADYEAKRFIRQD